MRRMIFTIATFVLALAAQPASAYELAYCGDQPIKWSGTAATLYASSTSFPSGYWENGIRDTVADFNRNPGRFRYGITMDTGGSYWGNGQSEIWGSTSISFVAAAWPYSTCFWLFGWHTWMNEVDVVFNYNSPFNWTMSDSKYDLIRYQGTRRSAKGTGLHELGHGLVLMHENDEYNIMGTDFEHVHVNGSTAYFYTGEDAGDGAVRLYGDRGGWQDVGVAHWKYSGAAGEYSDHTKTVIYNASGSVLPTTTVRSAWELANGKPGETGYRVSRGQWVQVEFTYENNGSNTQTPQIGYYISTNDYISTLDRYVGGWSLTLSRDNVYTTTKWIQIPSDLTPNTSYWIGAVIDNNGAIGEQVEWNNATYIPILVQ